MLGSDAEVPLGEVDDPALGHGLKALLALAVVPQPDPGVLVHLHRQEGYSGVLRGTQGYSCTSRPAPDPGLSTSTTSRRVSSFSQAWHGAVENRGAAPLSTF